MLCLEDGEFASIDKLIHNKLNELARQKTSSAYDARKHLLNVRYKLIQLKCTTLSRYGIK